MERSSDRTESDQIRLGHPLLVFVGQVARNGALLADCRLGPRNLCRQRERHQDASRRNRAEPVHGDVRNVVNRLAC